MLPARWVFLPDRTINTLMRTPGVYVNLRPLQWATPPKFISSDAQYVFPTVRNFLKGIHSPTKVVILFQGYGLDVGTAVVEMKKVTCCADIDYPCLDFAHPEIMDEFFKLFHFWGAFILAIARVPSEIGIFAEKDPSFVRFTRLVKNYAY